MKKILFFVTPACILAGCLALAFCCRPVPTADYNVVPLPHSVEPVAGEGFTLKPSTVITYPTDDARLADNAQLLSSYIREVTGYLPMIAPDDYRSRNVIALSADSGGDPEGYTISVTPGQVTIAGGSAAGNFYGIQTLRKSLPVGATGRKIVLPAAHIVDEPRFAYRGMHFDVARHFYSVDFIKSYIDILALHNVNRLHWHLTDDQGWRVEIKKYPELAEKGQWRRETLIGSNRTRPHTFDGTPYGGYYTQEEIRDIVRYAADRYITVIPEIDLPGHMLAALSAYPELGCTGGPYEAATRWGIFPDILCMGNDDTYTFLEDIFVEIVALFPSELIHIGGDEAPKGHWETCPKCQAKIRELGIRATAGHSAENRLQSYAVRRLEEFLAGYGRKVIGWDEILEGGIGGDAVVMSWRGTEGGIAAAEQGHDAIMTPYQYLYFDYYQSQDTEGEPCQLQIGQYLPVEKVYSYEPVPEVLTPDQAKHIIGVQANLWTEYVTSDEQAQYMLLPRLAALSEVQWMAPGRKDYDGFIVRLQPMFERYDALGYNYAPHVKATVAVAAQ